VNNRFALPASNRCAGIPARAVRGHSAVFPTVKHPSPHTIPQVYLSGIGWIDFDFEYPLWSARTDFVRMYLRTSGDYGFLQDATDPTKDCDLELIATEL